MTPLYGFSTDPIIRRKESIMQLSNNVKVEQYTSSESNFDIEFAKHQHDIKTGNMEKAIQSFVLLQSNSMENTKFQEYLIEISKNIDSSKNAELSGFFASLPCLLQSNIIDFAKDHLAVKNELQAFHILFDYIQEYPRHAYKYMIEAIDMLIHLIETENAEDKNKCFHILVADLLPRLSKQRLLLNYSECTASVKSTDSKHYIIIPLYLYEKYIMIGQSYFISNRNWDELTKFTCMMISTIGYNGYEQLNTVSHTIRFQYLKEHRLNVHIDDITESQNNVEEQQQLKVSATLMCEYMVVISQFVYFGYEYYKSVCGSNVNETSSLEKTCLVPICAFQSFLKKSTFDNNNNNNNSTNNNDDPIIKSEIIDSDVNNNNNNSSRKRQLSGSHSPDNDDRQKKTKLDIPDRGQGLSAECMKGVDYALQVLSKAADCLRHLVDMCQWASINSLVDDQSKLLQSWERELNRIIAYYNLPFDIKNAVLLVQSDLALSLPSVPGNLAKALELSQTICDRIEAERRNENKSEELDIPFMFAFRVLYSIAVIYLLVGSVQQSTLEIAIILSVFPIPIEMNDTSFIADEIDCGIVSKVFQDHEFGLMQVNQVGLVVRCIKHLVVGLDNESEQRTGLASIDSAMRWDEKAGNMIVLMQYGWPYWNLRTNMWEKIINRIKEKRVFKNREFLEYIYVEDVLKTIQSIHDSGSTIMDIIPPEFALRGSYRHLITPQPTRLSSYAKDTNTVSSSTSTATVAESSLSTTNNNNNNSNNNNSDKKSSTDDDLIDPTEDDNDDKNLPSRSAPPPIYQPSFSNQILPSMTMSPSWYAASTQKNEYASWMSPSFYYSRPATSVLLAKKQKELSDKYSEPNENHHYSHPHRHHHHNNNKNDDNTKLKSIQDSDEPITPFIPRDIVSRCLDYRLQRYSPKVTPQRMRHVLQKFLKNMVLKGNDEV